MVDRNKIKIAEMIKESFYEGYSSYQTPCNTFTNVDDEWEQSLAKENYDKLIKKA